MRLLHKTGRQSKYAIHASELATLSVEFPGFQREVAEEHVQKLIQHQKEMFASFGYYLFLGCLEFARYNGVMYCIDGQHRYYTICSLIKEDPLMDFEVVVEIIDTLCLEEAEELFQLVNMSKPLPSFLLSPATIDESIEEFLPQQRHEYAKELRKYIQKEYKPFLSKSEKPQKPNVNVDLFVEKMLVRYPEAFNATVNDWFERENQEHAVYLETQRANEPIAKCLDAIAKKGDGKKLYLGCYWLESLENKLTAPMRQKAWKAWYTAQPTEAKLPSGEIRCPCCESTLISAGHFHAGHRTSFKNGGAHSVENLIPLCAPCNLSMGVMNYDQYKATFDKK